MNNTEIQNGIKKLKNILTKLEDFKNSELSSARKKALESEIKQKVLDIFGESSYHFQNVKNLKIYSGGLRMNMPEYEYNENVIKGVSETAITIESLIEALEEMDDFKPEKVDSVYEEVNDYDQPLKVFISYSNADKTHAGNVKRKLLNFNINGFLAHEDIHCSEEWAQKIYEELQNMDVFVALLSNNFNNKPEWTYQECGIAYAQKKDRKVKIIPLSLDDTIPVGFLHPIQGKKYDDLTENLIRPIVDAYPLRLIPSIVSRLETVGSFAGAETLLSLLAPHFDKFTDENARDLVKNSLANRYDQVCQANLCAGKYIPKFLEVHSRVIEPDLLAELQKRIKE